MTVDHSLASDVKGIEQKNVSMCYAISQGILLPKSESQIVIFDENCAKLILIPVVWSKYGC